MKHLKSTLKLFSLVLATLLFCSFTSTQSRGGDYDNVPNIDIEVDAGAALVETGVQYVFSYPVSVESPSWISFDEVASDSREIVCLRVEENRSASSREATVLIKNPESMQVTAVVRIVQSGR